MASDPADSLAALAWAEVCISELRETDSEPLQRLATALEMLVDLRPSAEGEPSFFDAAGFPTGWRARCRRARQDMIVRAIAQQHHADLIGSPGELMKAVCADIRRSERSRDFQRAWEQGRRPSGLTGLVFDLLKLREFPRSSSQLYEMYDRIFPVCPRGNRKTELVSSPT